VRVFKREGRPKYEFETWVLNQANALNGQFAKALWSNSANTRGCWTRSKKTRLRSYGRRKLRQQRPISTPTSADYWKMWQSKLKQWATASNRDGTIRFDSGHTGCLRSGACQFVI
jgi:nitrate reductase beta subunit